jgi:predicted DNA-binding ArsR family transcriptional regulator
MIRIGHQISRALHRAIKQAQSQGSAWRMRSDANYQQEIDSSMTTHDSINLLMSFLKLEISEEL